MTNSDFGAVGQQANDDAADTKADAYLAGTTAASNMEIKPTNAHLQNDVAAHPEVRSDLSPGETSEIFSLQAIRNRFRVLYAERDEICLQATIRGLRTLLDRDHASDLDLVEVHRFVLTELFAQGFDPFTPQELAPPCATKMRKAVPIMEWVLLLLELRRSAGSDKPGWADFIKGPTGEHVAEMALAFYADHPAISELEQAETLSQGKPRFPIAPLRI